MFGRSRKDSYLFIYMVEDKDDFWVYDGELFLRFVMDTRRAWLVRTQAQLPAGAYGFCARFSRLHQWWMEREAGREGRQLPFEVTPQAAERAALHTPLDQYTFGLSQPAGSLDLYSQVFWREDPDGPEE